MKNELGKKYNMGILNNPLIKSTLEEVYGVCEEAAKNKLKEDDKSLINPAYSIY